jgi:hypothetical protein
MARGSWRDRSRVFVHALAGGLVALLPAVSPAETPAVTALVDRIETAYQARDLAALEATRGDLLAASPAPARAGYYAAYARFRQALGATDTPDAARDYLEDCIAGLNPFVAAHPADAEAAALLGSCYGLSTRYHPLAFVARGMEARRHLDAALAVAPENPWVVMQDGLADFATPRVFGGSRSGAIAKLERAARLFGEQAESGSRAAAWAEVETWQQLALMYSATGQAGAAAEAEARAARAPRATGRIRLASLR